MKKLEQIYFTIPEIKSMVYEAIGRNEENCDGMDCNMFKILQEKHNEYNQERTKQ